ncbi:T9SS type A sorting domain-containing protein [Dyadobacter diqingensis]|uniref:T9SS type A sorting domain-containing protein n=1 Tax=Dyadobacter diqingensis TaxID=2938121 RepID=UPI0020C1919B|nr:T9SS type A sorting domain-containing protein [Dyadobacter diqingensis]
MFKFLRFLFFCLCSFATFAQSPSLSIIRVNSENYCLGTELSIDVDVKGAFPSGNKFTVVVYRNWNNPAERWEYPAELKGDKLVTVLKEPSLANSQSFGLKVLTSNPQTETDGYYSIRALTKSRVQLTTRWGFKADTINSTDQIALAVIATPSTRGTVTLNTGDTFDLHYATDWTAPYPTFITLPKTKAGSYFIKEASNICGPMAIDGQVNIKVNPIDFMPVAFSPERPCNGGNIKVNFNTNGAEFDANTKFKIRFTSDNSYIDSYKYVDAPATLSGKNELTARVPENLTDVMRNDGIYLGIVTENPSAISIAKALKVYVYPKPSFILKAEKTSVNLGESIYLSGNPTGMPPFKITLTSGEVMEYSIQVSPEKTTNYQVKTFESGCGLIQNPSNTPVTVTVNPSLLLTENAYTSNPKIFCEGQTARLGFRANGVSSQTTYSLEANTYSGKKIMFQTKVVGDSLEFSIPKNTNQDRDLNYGEITGVRIISANPTLSSPFVSLKIQSPPTMVLAVNSQQSVQFPSPLRLDFDLLGGAPYTVEMENGSKNTYDYRNVWFEQFVKRDTTFKLTRLSNTCFVNNNPPSFPIKVVNPAGTTPSVFARLIKKPYCMGDSVEVELAVHGQFDAGNQFTLSYLRFAQSETFTIRNVTKSGIYKVKLPVRMEEGYDASLQISSTLPRLTSETERFFLGVPPRTPTISPIGRKENPERMYLGAHPRVTINGSAYSPVIYSVDGQENKVISDNNGRYNVALPLQNGKTSEFKLKSVTNACGAWNGEIVSYFYGIGYKMVIDQAVFGVWHCTGSEAEVRFSFESGKATTGTKFTLQISPSGDAGSYTDVATVTDSQIIRFVTPNLKAGSYYTRIYSSDNIYSETRNILIGQAPTANLISNYPTPGANNATVEYGTPVYMTANLTGNEPWGIVYSDGMQQQVTSNYGSYSPVITAPQTFTIAKVWNSCGYGTASGSVSVKVKSALEINKFPANADPTICPGQKIQLNFAVKGPELPVNAYLVFSIRGDKGEPIKLDSVNSLTGRIQLTIPDNIAGEVFFVKAEITSLQLSKTIAYQLYSVPDLTLIGDNIITAGESTKLYVRSNSTFAYNTPFELSDGKSYLNTAPSPGGITEIKVAPSTTTTYTLKPLQSVCGSGKVSGSATITVQPKLAQWLSLQRIESLRRSNICNSDTVQVHFYLNGNQGNNPEYEVLLSDSTGKNLVSIPTSGQSSPVTAIIPTSVKRSGFYRLRLNSKDPKVSGSTYAETLRIGERARAKILTPSVLYQAGQSVNVVIGLEGSSPFSYRFGDENFFQYRSATKYSDTLKLTPVTPLATYKISQVSNECGTGTIEEPSSLRIELITATEPLEEIITFGPNPTTGTLFIRFEGAAVRNLEIMNIAGQVISSGRYIGKNATVDLSAFPAGVYLLQVRKKRAVATYRIVKY